MYEDASVLVVDKPAGMATHGFSGRDLGTLANFLAAERPDLLMIGKSRWEPGLVHRLDRETSGLVLVAKTQAAFDDLRLQFRRRQVKKKYWALVWGITEPEGAMAYPIAHDSRDKKRMRAISDISPRPKKQKSWAALTRFRKLWDADGLSLLEIEMETGVTHQIRVHLAATGHPIVGDILYGENDREKFSLERQFLHAYCLEFFHPRDRRVVKIESELPLELEGRTRAFEADALSCAAADALDLGAGSTKAILGSRFLDPALVEIVTDFLAFKADEINSVDALIDFLAVEDPTSEFLDANTQQLFVVLLDLASARFVAW